MKTQKHNKSLITPIALVLMALFSLVSCKNDDALPQTPTINLSEVGSGNSKVAYIGGDLHLDAEILAEGLIAKIEVEIHQERGEFEFKETWTEGSFIGVKNADFHVHFDIPSNAPEGDYHLHLTVTDGNGRTATAESDLKLMALQPSAALIFTEVTGEGLEAHGDHFHGLGNAVEGESITVTFDANGNALSNGHLHLDAETIYKLELKTFDAEGNETQNQYIATKAAADQYKAFLIGGNLKLNSESEDNEGALFQPRELQHGDGTDVTGSGGTGTVGILSYFIIGHENEDLNDDVTFILRKVNAGVKPNITRNDWNRNDYATAFAGENVLELEFEIHAEHGHGH